MWCSFILVILSFTAYSCCCAFIRTNVTFHIPNYSGECGQLDFVLLSSTGHQYHTPIRYFCSMCYFTSEAENHCYHYLLWPARGYWTRPLELICFSHRGSVSWLESAPNSSHAIACSGVDLFPYLRKIKQSSMLRLLLNISSWRFSFMRNPFFLPPASHQWSLSQQFTGSSESVTLSASSWISTTDIYFFFSALLKNHQVVNRAS